MAKQKVYDSVAAAVADIPDGASIFIGGFGHAIDKPQTLLKALREQGAKNLTLIGNAAGGMGKMGIGALGGVPFIDEEIVVENGQVKKVICSIAGSLVMSKPNAFERLYREGKIEMECVPQGTLAEKIRCGGAGIGGFYTPTGVGTLVDQGKEKRVLGGREMLFEEAIRADYALIRAYKADTYGNLIFHGVMRSFNAIMAQAADVAIVEVDEIVPAGELDPETIVTPGIYIDRIVLRGKETK